MRVASYDEVDRDRAMRLNAMAFNWLLDAEKVAAIRKLDPACSDWLALYLMDGQEPVAQVGVCYPRLMTTEGEMKAGFVWGVATRPGLAHRGLQKQLFGPVHERMLDDGADLFVLMTLRSFVAHRLYEKFDYKDIMPFNWSLRRRRAKSKSNLNVLKKQWKSKEIVELYREASEGMMGFSRRADDFVAIRRAWTPTWLDDVCLLERRGRALGYALLSKWKDRLVIQEICCPEERYIPECVAALERAYDVPYIQLSTHTKRSTVKWAEKAGLTLDLGTYIVFMARGARRPIPKAGLERLLGMDKGMFQMTDLDSY